MDPMENVKFLWMAIFIMAILLIAFIVLSVIMLLKEMGLQKKYDAFMKGADGASLESSMLTKYKEIDKLKKETKLNAEKLDVACETLINSFQKMGIVKYDAFAEMGGKLSYSLCLLDDKDNGFIITSIHSREGCNSYIKEIIRGKSYVIMSTEERQALEAAQRGSKYSDI
ncbi:MAG: DUF4446 family protein [Lachnospiraceae bacterium]|nr:DUF4446 family protein [Lachnospiraceae bacterium]